MVENMDSQSSPTAECGGIQITRRTDKSLLMNLLHYFLRPMRPRLVLPRHTAPSGSQKLTSSKKASRLCHVHEHKINDIWVYDMTQKAPMAAGEKMLEAAGTRNKSKTRTRVVYFAGGGWQMPPSPAHWALMAKLVNRVPGLTATLVSYPLAPNSPAAVAMPQLKDMYESIMEESMSRGSGEVAEKVIVAGDSSGGNIALSLTLWALASETPEKSAAPAAILAISPSTDLRHVEDKLNTIEKLDPLLTVAFITSTAQAWSAGGSADAKNTGKKRKANINTSEQTPWSSSDPRVSPVLADLSVLARHGVKLYCVTGTHDVLSHESHVFREKCHDAGVEGEWLEWEGQMHCFPLAHPYGLRESRESVEWIIDAIRRI